MADTAFIAVDWGTTNRRVYVIDTDEKVIATERDGCGILAVPAGGYPAEAAGIRARFGDVPLLCAGMVGSARGWAEVQYLPCPSDLAALAHALCWVEPSHTAIVPGLSLIEGRRADVMRGEEVQLLGAVAAGLAPVDGLLCQPGTHCKWAQMGDAGVASFRTTLTGELFALLKQHSLLADFISGAVTDGPAFQAGVAAAENATLLGDLFGVRASVLLGARPSADAAAFISGLLIGTDVREQQLGSGLTVHLLADPELSGLYATAIVSAGAQVVSVDSHAAFVAGITAIWKEANAPTS